jgi:CBS domain-containing protein
VPDSIARATIREIEPLRDDDPIGVAARRIIDENLPALPAVDERGRFAGIFGEREFIVAFFPAYMGTLASAAMVRRSIDETIERRMSCVEEPIRDYLTTDHVVVEDEYSDTQLAELFLHHRILIAPIATEGRVHALVTRNDFFRALAGRVVDSIEDFGS